MPPCSPLSSTSPHGRAKRACLTGTVHDGRACAWAGMKERAPLGPNQGTASTRRTTQPHISYTDPTPNLSTKTGQAHGNIRDLVRFDQEAQNSYSSDWDNSHHFHRPARHFSIFNPSCK